MRKILQDYLFKLVASKNVVPLGTILLVLI